MNILQWEAQLHAQGIRLQPLQCYVDAVDRSARANSGYALETIILHEPDQRGGEAGYIKSASGFQADFLTCIPDGSQELIQVYADATRLETPERELRTLADAAEEHSRKRRPIAP